MATHTTETTDEAIRETYEEYDVGDTRLAMIADPENEHAWIQSDQTEPIEQ
ncbi:hypothetical protein [Halosimplex amylolyticum]|uniref:hypothetical protein n=1 Tax=Halosimplex amylolyticum TaxID=3396616 RepID=UPI003F567BE5